MALSRTMKKCLLVGKNIKRTRDFVFPAKAGIQSFFEPLDI